MIATNEDIKLLIEQYWKQIAELDSARSMVRNVVFTDPGVAEYKPYKSLSYEERLKEFNKPRTAMEFQQNLRARISALELNTESLLDQIGKITELDPRSDALIKWMKEVS